ncbi:MAG: uracil phosphoribosyltransferase [Clostridiales bacterium]|jgi:uracil phosphoribosyltransferase|nr:uracil phosphoribosyltransferase [Clostridiales bacterium]
MNAYKNVTIFDHPLIEHKIALLRDKNTSCKQFRELVEEIAMLMGYEALRTLPTEDIEVETPLMKTTAKRVKGDIVVTPVLRAGLGMVGGILALMPNAKVGHIGLFRDHETFEPVTYYEKYPVQIKTCPVFILDPMLATGGSAAAAADFLKKAGAQTISLMSIIAAPEGIERMQHDHPDVHVYCACVDDRLNEHAYILPGLGDAGDRIFGTKD